MAQSKLNHQDPWPPDIFIVLEHSIDAAAAQQERWEASVIDGPLQGKSLTELEQQRDILIKHIEETGSTINALLDLQTLELTPELQQKSDNVMARSSEVQKMLEEQSRQYRGDLIIVEGLIAAKKHGGKHVATSNPDQNDIDSIQP